MKSSMQRLRDNAANNKWLISGQGALIMNPPGAWAVAVRDAPDVAAQLWTFHSPSGPKGRFDPCNFGFWGLWNFSTNKIRGEEFACPSVDSLLSRAARRRESWRRYSTLRKAAQFQDLGRGKAPAGTLYNYPPRDEVTAFLAGYSAPPGIGTQMATQGTICKMVAVCTPQGK